MSGLTSLSLNELLKYLRMIESDPFKIYAEFEEEFGTQFFENVINHKFGHLYDDNSE